MTLGLPVYLGVVLAVLGISLLAYNVTALQYSLKQAARFASIGETIAGMTREQSVHEVLRTTLADFGINAELQSYSICPVGQACASPNAGAPGESVEIRATVPLTLGTPFSFLDVERHVVIRNEPFDI